MLKFGTDGIRDIYPTKINENIIYSIGKTINFTSKVIIGYDTRYSSKSLANALCKALKENNINLNLIGIASTPKVAYLSKIDNCLGIVITASHNPYFYNGIKFLDKGKKIDSFIKNLIINNYIELEYKGNEEYEEKEDYRYENYLKTIVKNNKYKVLFDFDHGGLVGINKNCLPINSKVINDDYDGYNINDKVGALYPNYLKQKLNELDYDIGFCYDGDGDRLMLIDKKFIYDGDMILYLLAKLLKHDKIVSTIMSNSGLKKCLNNNKIDLITCDVGDEKVYEKLVEFNILIGGEKAGHIIDLNHLGCGDGLYVSLLIIKLLNDNKIDLKEIFKDYKSYYYEELNYPVNINLDRLNIIKNTIDNLDENSRIYIRKSGTENKIRVLLESNNYNRFNHLKKMIEDNI